MPRVITLTTDFGNRDAYAASVKGVILGICPTAAVVDITHEVAAHDIAEGAHVLSSACRWFPPDTVHVAVVDPGVGGTRNPIAVRAGRFFFVGPDNGLLSRAWAREREMNAVRVENRRYRMPEVSRTFHGRDVFAPAAAHLARGVPLEELGPPLADPVRLPDLRPSVSGEAMTGAVIHVDRFGNAITNIGEDDFRTFVGRGRWEIAAGNVALTILSESYDAVPAGAPLAIFGSSGELEISVHRGDAGKDLAIRRGDRIRILRLS